MPKYHYTMISTKDSSAKYGPCEICKKHCSEVFHQIEEREIEAAEEPGKTVLTHAGCWSYFGHENCLIGKRR